MTARPTFHLSPQELEKIQASTEAGSGKLVVDIRPRHSFRSAHIPGSHNIPLANLVSGEPPEGDLVLIGGSDQDSARAIEALHRQGYPRRIEHLGGGFDAWRDQGLPVEGADSQPRLNRLEQAPWIPLIAVATLLLLAQPRFLSLSILSLAIVLAWALVQRLAEGVNRRITRQRLRV
ncbi:MAG: rhodanese-like domain-containing protein [Prochlorococcaceae cyanobacterium]